MEVLRGGDGVSYQSDLQGGRDDLALMTAAQLRGECQCKISGADCCFTPLTSLVFRSRRRR
jgi:hypothetical protein